MVDKSEVIKQLKILNIPLDVDFSLNDIHSAYKLMARLYHPDAKKASNANDMMVKINNAKDFIEKHYDEIKSFNLHLNNKNQTGESSQKGYSSDFYQNQQKSKADQTERRRQAEEAERKRQEAEAERQRKAEAERIKRAEEEKRVRREKRKNLIFGIKASIISFLKNPLKVIFSLSVLLIALISLLTFVVFIPNRNYKEAMELIREGNFEEANMILKNLEDFSDSEKQLIIIRAYEAFENGEILVAIELIEDIGRVEIDYDYNGGQNLNQLSFSLTSSISNQNPVKEGYSFTGWDLVSYSINNNKDNYSAAIFLKAIWEINQYTISFDSNGGSSVTAITQGFDTILIKPNNPNRTGYTFGGWYLDKELKQEFNFDKMASENQTLYARWLINDYKITLELNGGFGETEINNSYGVVLTEPIPTRDGYTFEGWYMDATFNQKYTFTTMPAENITLYGKWEPIIYSITYILYSGSNESNPSNYTIETQKIILNEPTKEGHAFNGWYNNAEFTGERITQIPLGTTGDITLYSKWEPNKYVLTLIYNDDITANQNIDVFFDSAYGNLPIPARLGFKFDGWFKENDEEVLSTDIYNVTQNQTLNAKWSILTYYATFETNGGIRIDNLEFNMDSPYIELPIPLREGYRFKGWHNDPNLLDLEIEYIESGTVGDRTYYADWELITYLVSFDAQDPEISNPTPQIISYFNGIEYPLVAKPHTTFMGWFDNAEGLGEPYDFEQDISSDLTLYAKWAYVSSLGFPYYGYNVGLSNGFPSGEVKEFYFHSLKTQTIHFSYTYGGYLNPNIIFEVFEDDVLILKTDTKNSSYLSFSFDVNPHSFYKVKMYNSTNDDVSDLINISFVGEEQTTPNDGGIAR